MSVEAGSSRRVALVAALSWSLALSPFLIFLVASPQLGELPRNDYWGAFAQVLDGDRIALDPGRWFDARINEHRVAVPLALWTVNAYASGGDDRVLRAVAFLFLLATAVLLLRQLPNTVRSHPGRFAALGFLISAWLASPVAARAWAVGFIGTTWLIGNWIVVGAIVCFTRLLETPDDRRWPRFQLTGLIALGALGLLTLVTTLAVWPALCLGALGLAEGQTRRRLGIFVGLLSALWFGLFLFSAGLAAGEPLGFHPGEWLTFVATLLGQPFALEAERALIWGTGGLVVLVAGAAWLLRRRPLERRRYAMGLLLALAAAGSGLEMAVGRAGGGELVPLSGRYGPIALLFWAGVTWAIGVFWVERFGARLPVLAAGWLVGAAALLPTLPVGSERLREELTLAELQPLGTLAIVWEVPDRVGLASVAAGTAQVQRSRAFFTRIGHKPFDRRPLPLGARFEDAALARYLDETRAESAGSAESAPSEGLGRWNEFQELSPDFGRVSGSLPETAPALERVVLLSADRRLCGAGVSLSIPFDKTMKGKGAARVRRATAFRHGRAQGGRMWTGYLSRACTPPIDAFGEFAPPLGWRRLKATDSVREPARRWLVR